jgi:8-amino-7-oxononanoate synthase
MPAPLRERLSRELDERRGQGLFRSFPASGDHQAGASIDLSTNSYLDLHKNAEIRSEALRLAKGDLSGNLASRLISETSPLFRELETELAAWKGTETALLFNSGYAANLGILQALCRRDTAVFSDRLNHASLIDGMLLSGCRIHRYHHGDMADLKNRLEASDAVEKIIVTDTVFSMDGDVAPVADICVCAKDHGAMVMVDEAHATGIFGATGSGIASLSGCADAIDIRMGTLSKAIAGLGGFFAGSTLVRDYLVNHSRSLIYSTGLPHSVIAWDLAAVRHLRQHPEKGAELLRIAEKFRSGIRDLGFDTLRSTTQIIPCCVGDAMQASQLSRFLRERGIIAPGIRPPTVPRGSSRVRFSVHLGLTEHEITTVLSALKEWKSRHG